MKGKYKGEIDYNPEAIVSERRNAINSIYDTYKLNLKKASKEYAKTPEQQIFLENEYKKINTPFHYKAADSWNTMFLYITTISLILELIIGYITASIFSDEFQNSASLIFFSSKYGRSKAVYIKILTSLIIATIVYIIGIGLLTIISFSIIGISGIETQYQLYYPYSIYNVSFGQMYAIIVGCGYIASILSASIAMFIVSKSRSLSIAICTVFLLFCVTPFVGRVLPFKEFFTLTPDQLNNIINCSRIPYIYQIGNFVFSQISFLIIFYLVVSIGLLPFIYRSYNQLKC